jgi:hypothetical protein
VSCVVCKLLLQKGKRERKRDKGKSSRLDSGGVEQSVGDKKSRRGGKKKKSEDEGVTANVTGEAGGGGFILYTLYLLLNRVTRFVVV